MRNKLAYSYSVKIHASGFNKLLEGIFCLLVVVEVFSLKKVVQMLEEVVDGWWVMTWIWWMRQNFIAQFVQLLKRRLCGLWLGIVVEKNWALSVDQCQLQALQFLVHLIDLLSILLRCNSFAMIHKAVLNQRAADHQTVIMTLFDACLALGYVLSFSWFNWLLPVVA